MRTFGLILVTMCVGVTALVALIVIDPFSSGGSAAPNQTEAADEGLGEELTVEDAMAFDEFELFWLGEEFMGHRLRGIVHQEYDLGFTPLKSPYPTEVDSVTFLYGDCTPTPGPESSCTLPIAVHVDAYCTKPPHLLLGPYATADGSLEPKEVSFGSRSSGLWTEDVFISVNVSPDAPSLATVVDALRSMDPDGRQPGEDFRPITVPGC
jgi:hypothetical protein